MYLVMFRPIIVFLLLGLMACSTSKTISSQDISSKGKKQYDKAVALIKKGKKEDGIKKLEELAIQQPQFVKSREKLVGLYWKDGNLDKTINHLEELVKLQPENMKYRINLADAYIENQQFSEARTVINKLETTEDKATDRKIQELSFRVNAMENPVPFDPVPIQGTVNSESMEYHPILTADGQHIYFVSVGSGRFRHEDIYSASIDETTSRTEDRSSLQSLNTQGQEGAFTLSQNGRILIFTGCERPDAIGGCDLYISVFKDGQWSSPRNMGDKINSRYWDASPSLGSDNKTLYFSSKRPGGKGGSDIWVSKLVGRAWSDPKNLGDRINTSKNDETPFIHPDMKTLYFVSDGHVGMGSYDIFYSKLEDNTWSRPQNMGYPINTSEREGGLSIDLNGNRAYYSSMIDFEEKEGSVVSGDIYYFDLPEDSRPDPMTYVKVKVIDKETKNHLAANVDISGLGSVYKNSIKSNANGDLITLPQGMYAVLTTMEGYTLHSENIDFNSGEVGAEPFEYVIELMPIKKIIKESEPIILHNIFFESGSAELLDVSMVEIDQLYDIMNKNPEISIRILGHTDNVGSEMDNMVLSKSRAKSVYNVLQEKGIPAARLAYEGKGETQPIAENDTEVGRQKNRRTEFVIVR